MKDLELCGIFYGHEFYVVEEGLFLVQVPIGVQYDNFFIEGLRSFDVWNAYVYAENEFYFWDAVKDYEVTAYHRADELECCRAKLQNAMIALSR